MIYLTGDIHGSHSIRKLARKRWPVGPALTRGDLVVILGDFGLFWYDPPSRDDRWWLGWLDGRPWTTCFVDGNHENHDLLDRLPTQERWGGVVGVDPRWPHVVHLRRGEVYDLPVADGETARTLAFGGARSHDIGQRIEGVDWWPRELPNHTEYERARERLGSCGWEVDYVLTHEAPARSKSALLADSWDSERLKDDQLVRHLSDIDGRLRYRRWYHGHYHVDEDVCAPDGSGRRAVTCLYHEVVRLGCGVGRFAAWDDGRGGRESSPRP